MNAGKRSPAAAPACPDLEALAAFADGRLNTADRATVTVHLTSCETCYEIVAETLRILDEDQTEEGDERSGIGTETAAGAATASRPAGERRPATVVRHPRARRSARIRSAGARPLLAAAAVAVLALGAWWWSGLGRRPGIDDLVRDAVPGMSASDLGESWNEHTWTRTRGPASHLQTREREFRLGVLVVDLQLALIHGDPRADRFTGEIGAYLEEVGLADLLILTYGSLRDAGTAAAADHVRAERDLDLFLDSPFYRLGKWTEAIRLAALAGNRPFLGRAAIRSFPASEKVDWPAQVSTQIARLAAVLEGGVRDDELVEVTAATTEIIHLGGAR